ncbi:MAG: dihydrodipicolinate synthase family protein [Bryobacteraceae bacterium]
MLRFNGITPVMVTPFLEDETIDEAALRRQIDFAIDSGAVAVCGPGFASEFYKLSDPERYRFAEILVDQARKRVPVIVATSSDSTHNTIEFSRFAERISADCVMVTPPRTSVLPASQVIEYYSKLCDRITIPVILQDADFKGAGMPASVLIDLSKRHENFLFAKLEVMLPGQKAAEIIEKTAGRVQIIYGLGGIAMMDGLARKASAFMPGAAYLDIYVRTYSLFHEGRKDEAKEYFSRFVPYLAYALQHLELAVSMEKAGLARRGVIPDGRMRHPSIKYDPADQAQIEGLISDAIDLCAEAGKYAGAAR